MELRFFLPMALLALSSITLHSQTEKGNKLFGVQFSFEKLANNTGDASATDARLNVGGFVLKNFAVGGSLVYQRQKQDQLLTLTTYGVAPFLRYYLGGPSVKVFAHGMVGYYGALYKNGSFEGSDSAWFLSAGPGVSVFVTPNVAVEGLLAYNQLGGDFNQETLSFGIAVEVFLGRK